MDMTEFLFKDITLIRMWVIVISILKLTSIGYSATILRQTVSSLSDQFNVSRYWKSRKYRQKNRWLQSWLRREIQALIQEEDVEIFIHHISGMIDSLRSNPKSPTSPEASRENFKTVVSKAAMPFMAGRADRFVNEVELFLASGLNIEAYDQVYMHHLGWKQNPDEEAEIVEHKPVVPHLHFFDEDFNES